MKEISDKGVPQTFGLVNFQNMQYFWNLKSLLKRKNFVIFSIFIAIVQLQLNNWQKLKIIKTFGPT